MQESAIISFLIQNQEYFTTSSFLEDGLRLITWWIINGLKWLANVSQEFYEKCFDFLDFTSYGPVKSFLEEFEVAVVVILALSFVLIGYRYLFQPEKKSSFLTNLLIGMFVLTATSSILSSINSGMLAGRDYVVSNLGSSSSAANQIISSNLTDLIYVDKKIGMENMNGNNIPHASLTDEDISMIKYNEILKDDSSYLTTDKAEDILKKKIVYVPNETGSGNSYALDDIYNGLLTTDLLSEYYYRYHLNSFTVLLSLISLIVVFLVMGYKVIKLIWELVTSQFLAVLFSGEIFSGQTLKKLIDFVKNIYIVLLYTLVSVKLYLLASDLITAHFTSSIRGLILMCLSFAVADGPIVVEKLLGIDAGLQSGVGKLTASIHTVSGGFRTVQYAHMQHRMNKGMSNFNKKFGNDKDKIAGTGRENYSSGQETDFIGNAYEEKGMPTDFSEENNTDAGFSNNQDVGVGNNEMNEGFVDGSTQNMSENGFESNNNGASESLNQDASVGKGDMPTSFEGEKGKENWNMDNQEMNEEKRDMPTNFETGSSRNVNEYEKGHSKISESLDQNMDAGKKEMPRDFDTGIKTPHADSSGSNHSAENVNHSELRNNAHREINPENDSNNLMKQHERDIAWVKQSGEEKGKMEGFSDKQGMNAGSKEMPKGHDIRSNIPHTDSSGIIHNSEKENNSDLRNSSNRGMNQDISKREMSEDRKMLHTETDGHGKVSFNMDAANINSQGDMEKNTDNSDIKYNNQFAKDRLND